jgi:hypothetical protein
VDREPSGDPAAARLVLKAGDMLEVDFDVIDNLDPAKALPSHPLRMRYRNVDAIDPRRLYAEWFDAVGARRFVYFVQEDALERGLLQFTRRGLHGANSALPPQCLAARAALGK